VVRGERFIGVVDGFDCVELVFDAEPRNLVSIFVRGHRAGQVEFGWVSDAVGTRSGTGGRGEREARRTRDHPRQLRVEHGAGHVVRERRRPAHDDDPGSTPFLADELIVDGSITAVVGSPKHGKTWVLLDIAIAVETGENALGRFAVPKPVQCC